MNRIKELMQEGLSYEEAQSQYEDEIDSTYERLKDDIIQR